MDKFHVVQSITRACGGNYYNRKVVFKALRSGQPDELKRVYKDLYERRSGARITVKESYIYLSNNFDKISFDKKDLCSAEGHISHILSSRLSSRPCGWTIAGAKRIANLRAFLYNKGDFAVLAPYRNENVEKILDNSRQFSTSRKNEKHIELYRIGKKKTR